ITNSQRIRDSAVVMSSTMPSAKYSCSGSPLRFWNGRTAMDGLSGSAGFEEPAVIGKFVACDAAVTAPWSRMLAGPTKLEPILAARLLPKHPTQGGDLHGEVALLDSETGPRGFHQRVLGNRDAPSFHEHAQQCNGTAAQRNGLVAAEQCVRLRIKAERTEDVRCCHLLI